MDEAFLNDLLECSVCLDQLDSTSKVLPCQHTFCKRCLEEIVNSHKELRCPECRVLVETKVDDLPCNILLIRLLEGIKNNPRLAGNCPGKRPEPSLSHGPLPLSSPHPPVSRQGTQISGDGRTLPKQTVFKEFTAAASTGPLPILRLISSSCRPSDVSSLPRHVAQSLPCAKALYPYEGKEPGDLSFKKGDIIILQKRVDQNWYQGEVNGKSGYLPARYVQVMGPLPTHFPQCKALYDFCISDNDEEDCLTFTKGEVITVIRRVDDNWAEGKLGERIGIFPISFVEMNTAARALMKLSMNTQPGPSRVAPPTPTTESLQHTVAPVTATGISVTQAPPAHDSMSSTTTSPSPASSLTSPSTPCSSSSASSTSLPSATSVPTTTQAQGAPPSSQTFTRSSSQRSNHHREKRHSLSALSSSQRSPQIPGLHRHSMEILSTTNSEEGLENSVTTTTTTTTVTTITSASSTTETTTTSGLIPAPSPTQWAESIGARVVRRHHEKENHISSSNLNSSTPTTSTTTSTTTTTNTSGTSGQPSTHAPVPTFYVALYNYKPQKEDELELKKSELYTVSEKCQDGWFKGTSLRTGRSGVFPGNYVQVAKSSVLQAQFHQASSSVANVRSTSSKSSSPATPTPPRPRPPAVQSQSTSRQSNSSSSPSPNINSVRNQSSTSPTSYLRPKHNNTQESHSSVTAGLLEWARSVAAIATPPQRPPRPQPFPATVSPATAQRTQVIVRQNGNNAQLQSPSRFSWLSNWAPTGSISAPLPTTTSSNAQGSYSMAASYPLPSSGGGHNMQSANNFPSSSSTGSITQSWHGQTRTTAHPSSPSLLSQAMMSAAVAVTPPNMSVGGGAMGGHSQNRSEKHKERKDKERVSLMKRLTSKRKSRSPPPSNYSCDNPSFVDTSTGSHLPSTVVHVRSGSCPSEALGGDNTSHKKSCSLDGTGVEATPNQPPARTSSRTKHSVPGARERFRCIVPYPPNSEYELELKVGDVVYVHKKREDGWYKGTLQRTGKTGLFPASFVEIF